MEDLLRELPAIKRARGYRLYDVQGRRYLDLYQNRGASLLGHRPPAVSVAVKNVISRGLYAPLPSVYERRLAKALFAAFPGYRALRVYANSERLLHALSVLNGADLSVEEIPDPVFQDCAGKPIAFFRPFLPLPSEHSPAVLLPIVPAPFPFGIALFKEEPGSDMHPSDVLSPVLLSGAIQALYDLGRYGTSFGEHVWSLFDMPGWGRRGPYLYPLCGKDAYPDLFREFLGKGILLSPFFPGPSIIPGEFSPGELVPLIGKKLKRGFP